MSSEYPSKKNKSLNRLLDLQQQQQKTPASSSLVGGDGGGMPLTPRGGISGGNNHPTKPAEIVSVSGVRGASPALSGEPKTKSGEKVRVCDLCVYLECVAACTTTTC